MQAPTLTRSTGGTLSVHDERGRLIGTIRSPVSREPLGPGRETVYLERPATRPERTAAVAA